MIFEKGFIETWWFSPELIMDDWVGVNSKELEFYHNEVIGVYNGKSN